MEKFKSLNYFKVINPIRNEFRAKYVWRKKLLPYSLLTIFSFKFFYRYHYLYFY